MLEGKVIGTPAPEIKWYRGDKEIKPNDHYKIENLKDGTQRLTIKNAQLDDMGEFRCEASNEYGDVWSDVTLTVKGRLSKIKWALPGTDPAGGGD